MMRLLSFFACARLAAADCCLRAHGAAGDGVTDDTDAVNAAIEECAEGGTIVASKGRYLTRGGIQLRSNMALEVQRGATMLLTSNHSLIPVQEDGHLSPFLAAYDSTNITIFGEGTLDGNGLSWWNWDTPQQKKPWFLYFERVRGLRIFGVSLVNPPFWTVHPRQSHDIHIHDISISCDPPQLHYNTDGIDPDSCTNVLIEDVDYSCGDDAIAIKASLQGAPGQTRDGLHAPSCQPTKNVTVRRLRSGGRGGFTIGSEMQGGIEDVVFENCSSTGVSGIRISAQKNRGGYIRNVRFQDISFNWPGDTFAFANKTFLFDIDQTYPSGGDPCPGMDPKAEFADFSFKNVTVVHSPGGLKVGHITCDEPELCHGITIDGLNFLDVPSAFPLTCANISGSQSNVHPHDYTACNMPDLSVTVV